MALHYCTVHKRLEALNGEKWVNTYWIDALGPSDALNSVEVIAHAEASVYPGAVVIWRLTAKQVPDGETALRGVNIIGELSVDPVNLVPMFNTVRVIMTDDVGRVESKYLRSVIAEANVQGFNISDELLDFINENYCADVMGTLGLRGPNGETINSMQTQKLIQMRQLGWHRRTRVGFKRGWVPA